MINALHKHAPQAVDLKTPYALVNTLLHKPVMHTPIWLMRQAGRYLPEYRAIRAKAGSFMNLCSNPELATIVTLQPLQRFELDAAILFSDILVVPHAMGMDLDFVENEGPKFQHPLRNIADIENLDITEITHKLNYVFEAIKNIKTELKPHIPLIGFSGSPFTLACYMLEGGASRNYLLTKEWLFSHKAASHQLLSKLADAVILYLNAQIEAGCDVIMLFDSWGGVLTEPLYLEFSLAYLHKILSKTHSIYNNKRISKIVFTKGAGGWLEHMATLDADVIGLDWTINIAKARGIIPKHIGLQGNLDPVLLAIGDKDVIRAEVMRILHDYKSANNGNTAGHIFNLGHGVLPMTNPDTVAYLVDTVHELSARV